MFSAAGNGAENGADCSRWSHLPLGLGSGPSPTEKFSRPPGGIRFTVANAHGGHTVWKFGLIVGAEGSPAVASLAARLDGLQ